MAFIEKIKRFFSFKWVKNYAVGINVHITRMVDVDGKLVDTKGMIPFQFKGNALEKWGAKDGTVAWFTSFEGIPNYCFSLPFREDKPHPIVLVKDFDYDEKLSIESRHSVWKWMDYLDLRPKKIEDKIDEYLKQKGNPDVNAVLDVDAFDKFNWKRWLFLHRKEEAVKQLKKDVWLLMCQQIDNDIFIEHKFAKNGKDINYHRLSVLYKQDDYEGEHGCYKWMIVPSEYICGKAEFYLVGSNRRNNY